MILNWVDADGKDKDGRKADAPPGSLRFVSPVVKGTKVKCLAGGGDEVTEAILPALGANVPVFGFYAWGELGRIRGTYQRLDHQYQQHTFVTSVVGLEE